MGNFKRGGEKSFGDREGGFNRRDGGRGGFGGGRDRGPVAMHQATCDQCGKPCEVPFRPTSGKPVYCSVCFEGKKEIRDDRGGDRFSQRSDTSKGNNNEVKRQLEILNGKMDLLIKAVEAIASTKPLVSKTKSKKVAKAVPAVKTKKTSKKRS